MVLKIDNGQKMLKMSSIFCPFIEKRLLGPVLELFDEADAPERVFIGAVLFQEFCGVQPLDGAVELDGEVSVSRNEMKVEEKCVLSLYPGV